MGTSSPLVDCKIGAYDARTNVSLTKVVTKASAELGKNSAQEKCVWHDIEHAPDTGCYSICLKLN